MSTVFRKCVEICPRPCDNRYYPQKVIHKKLSMVCNTWPIGTNENACRDICVCGHPWLETAEEDYQLWMAGETDAERQERRNYPTVEEWLRFNIRGTISGRMSGRSEQDQKEHETTLSIQRGLEQARNREFVNGPDLEADAKLVQGFEEGD